MALVHQVLSLICSNWLRGFRKPLKPFQNPHSEVCAVSQLGPHWGDLGYWDKNFHLGKTPQILIKSISYATVAPLQSFSQLGSFFASCYKLRGVLLVIIKEMAFMPFCFMLFSLYWRYGDFNTYTLAKYLKPWYPKLYKCFHLILPGTSVHSGALLTIFAEFSCIVEKIITLTSLVFSNAEVIIHIGTVVFYLNYRNQCMLMHRIAITKWSYNTLFWWSTMPGKEWFPE